MTIKCECTGFSLQDILLLIGLEGRTGEVLIEAGNNIGSIKFRDGNILLAFSPYSRAIGDLLVESGKITGDELIEMLQVQKRERTGPIGALFVKKGRVSLDSIEAMVHEQIRRAMRDFMVWKKPRVSFLEKDVMPADHIKLPVHEFIQPEVLKRTELFFVGRPAAGDRSLPASSAPAA